MQDFEWLCPNHHSLTHLMIEFILSNEDGCWFASNLAPDELTLITTLAHKGIQRIREQR
jgi:hypothetical protein